MRRLLVAVTGFLLAVGLSACRPVMRDPIAAGSLSPSPSAGPSVEATPSAAPIVESTPSPLPPAAPPKPVCKQGQYQLEVEKALAAMGGFGTIKVDGEQSDEDCAAIKKFQKRFSLRPDDGVAGPATNNVSARLLAADPGKCTSSMELTACIDLTNQTTWIMRDGKIIYGPTVTRTGFNHPDGLGAPTPSGSFKIIERKTKNWTESFKAYLYYWQRIMDNNGFHETTSYIHDMSLGSHGCVNLLHVDAVAYWETLTMGTPVQVFGRRPGT